MGGKIKMSKLEKIVRDKIIRRTIQEGQYIVLHHATIRATATEFGLSKSTIHRDIRVYLELEDEELFAKVQKILETNKAERHIRGGEATRLKCEIKLGINPNRKTKEEKSQKKPISSKSPKANVRHKKAAI